MSTKTTSTTILLAAGDEVIGERIGSLGPGCCSITPVPDVTSETM